MKKTTLVLSAFSALGLALSAFAPNALAQSYPNKNVKIIIPFPPGGTLDQVGRNLAQKLTEQTGQSFIVENRAGGNGIIGADAVAKAPGDGYTLLFNASTFVSAPMTMNQVPYSVTRDFAAVASVAQAPLAVSVHKNLPITDIRSLLNYAKSKEGRMTFAVGSIGSAGHLSTELLNRTGSVGYTVVPYRGTAPAMQDLIGGQIDVFIDPILGAVGQHRAGNLRIVAVTSSKRTPNLPDVPTVAETLAGYEFFSWYGLWAPVNTPKDIQLKLNAEVNKALASDMREKLTQQGLIVMGGSMEDFVRFQANDMAKSQKIITESKIRVE